MVTLNKRLHGFRSEEFGTYSQLRSLAESREDSVLFVGCSDQGTAPDNISFLDPDRVVIVQHIAAAIPHANERADSSTFGSIEYGVGLLQVSHIVICAHLGCKILKNWFNRCTRNEDNRDPSHHSMLVVATLDEYYSDTPQRERFPLFIQEYLLFQLENLRSFEIVKQKLESGELLLHAWLVNDSTARIMSYSPNSGQFEPIESVI